MSRKDSIKLSPKYGVNATMPVCFFCGEHKGEIALLGKIGGRGEDIEAPMSMVLDYEPCDKCKENFSQGVLLMEVSSTPIDERPPLKSSEGQSVYPTGRHCVMREEAFNRCFNISMKAGEAIFVDKEVMDMIFKDISDEKTN